MIWYIFVAIFSISIIIILIWGYENENKVLEIIFKSGIYISLFFGVIGIIGIVTVNILSLSPHYSNIETLCESKYIENFSIGSFIYEPNETEYTEYFYYSVNGDYYEGKMTDAKIQYIDDSSIEYINIYGYEETSNKIVEVLKFWFCLKDKSQKPSYRLSYCELYVHKDSNIPNDNIDLE